MATAPTPPLHQELADFGSLVRNYAEAGLALHRRHGDMFHLRLPEWSLHLIHPRHLAHVLKTNIANYPKSKDYDKVKPILGDGIFVSEGETWQRNRKLLSPEFRASVVPRYLAVIVRDVEALFAERWEPSVGGEPRDIALDMMHVTVRIVGNAIFARDFKAHADAIGHALEVCLDQATFLMFAGRLIRPWMPTPGNLRSKAAEKSLDDIVGKLIATARDANDQQGMLARLLAATDAEGKPAMDDRQLGDEVKSMILAGHETTSLALTWTLYLLAQHPEVRARLEAEVDGICGGRAPTTEEVGQLVYTKMVFKEAMRLYPPVPGVTREAREADEIDGVPVEKGTKIILNIYATHRHPDFWSDPERFDPERFTPERERAMDPLAYLPFLAGRRACLGEHFAMLEGIAALAMMVGRYRLTRADEGPIGTRPISTLRLTRPLKMRIVRRTA